MPVTPASSRGQPVRERLTPARLDVDDLVFEAPQRAQRDPERDGEATEQQERQQQRSRDDARAHAQELAVPRLEALGCANDEVSRLALLGLPADAERKPDHAGAVRELRMLEAPFARPGLRGEIEPAAGRGRRAPGPAANRGFPRRAPSPASPGAARRGSAARAGPSASISAVDMSAMTCASSTSSRARTPWFRYRESSATAAAAAAATQQDGQRQEQARLQRGRWLRHGQPRAIR